jgi:predicted aspartyl protease
MQNLRFSLLFLLLWSAAFGQADTDKTKIANRDKYLFSTRAENKNFVETVPFTVLNNLMFVSVQIQGTTYNFLFDTGAVTVISSKLQEKLQLKEVMRNNLIDGSGKEQVEKFYTIDRLKLGAIEFSAIGTASMDLEKMGQHFCTPIDGIIGANFMRSCYWKIDNKNKRLVFSDKKIKPQNKSYELDFEENFSGSPLVKVYFGEYNFMTIFDTGNNQYFNLPDSLYFKSKSSRNKILRSGFGNNEFTLYGNKTIQNHASLLDSITLGTKLFKKQMVRIGPSQIPMLGNKFFMKFDEIILDWKRHVIYLPEQYAPDEALKTFGFDPLLDDGKIKVSFIWDGSTAQQQGLQLGDIIVAINGKDVRTITAEEWCALRDNIRDTETIKIKVLKNDTTEQSYTISRYNLLD